jgi:hypothetical protein
MDKVEFNKKRKEDLEGKIQSLYKLLKDYETIEEFGLPKERKRAEFEIKNILKDLDKYINAYEIICNQLGENVGSSNKEVVSIISTLNSLKSEVVNSKNELVDGQNRILESQLILSNRIINILTKFHFSLQHSIGIILNEVEENELNIIQKILEMVDSFSLKIEDVNKVNNTVTQSLEELNKKVSQPNTPLIIGREIINKSKSPELDTKGKFKMTLPIIPMLLKYEAELSLNMKATLREIWEDLSKGYIFFKPVHTSDEISTSKLQAGKNEGESNEKQMKK